MKKLLLGCVAGLAMVSIAAVNDTLLTFSTPGTDKYADGATVMDGECYVLVWSADGTFEGIKSDGTPVDANDKVVLVAPVAKNGRCPTVVYQIDAEVAKTLAGGQYGVYLLDTRVKAADGTVTVASDGDIKAVNSAAVVGESASADGSIAKVAPAAAVADGAVAAYVQIDSPKITSMKVEGAKISLTVSGLSPAAQYKVVTGANPGEVATEIDATVDADGTVTFDKPQGTFFKVIGVRNF